MNELQNEVLKQLEQINNATSILIVGLFFLLLIAIGVVSVWAWECDKKSAEKRDKKIKDYIDEEIKNAKK